MKNVIYRIIFNKTHQNTTKHTIQFEIELQQNNADDNLICHNKDNQTNKGSKSKIVLYSVAFYLILIFAKMILFSLTELQPYVAEHFIYVYWLFTIYQMLLKRVLKHCARKIDQYRINCEDNDNFLCLEYLMEIYSSIYYYTWVKLYVAFHAPPSNLLVFTFISHFLTEFIETNVKFTNIYYKKLKILNCSSLNDVKE